MSNIRLLDPDSIRKISAGEIIEGPASVIRELLDNAIDAEAGHIDIHVNQGGIQSLRIHDNGIGMTAADLELCWRAHATSKIHDIDDLKQLKTRGFRGEALAAITAVARLRIQSKARDSEDAHLILLENNVVTANEPTTHASGTTITVDMLFHNIPARKRFLKNPSAETKKIRSIVWEKAMSVPHISMSYYVDDQLKKHFAPTTLHNRVAEIINISPSLLLETHEDGRFFDIRAILASPEKTSKTRSGIHIYVNNYSIRNFTLMQAIEYAYPIPGGQFPYAAVFLTIDPSMLDVNVHPTKRELRIQHIEELRYALIQAIKNMNFEQMDQDRSKKYEVTEAPLLDIVAGTPQQKYSPTQLWNIHKINNPREEQTHPQVTDEFRFLGMLYDTFLIVLYKNTLCLVDQHAAHERMIYDRLQESMPSQKLLIPIEFETSEEEAHTIQAFSEKYRKIGIPIQQTEAQKFCIDALPEAYLPLMDELPDCIRELSGLHDEFAKRFLANIACKSAIKSRDILSPRYIHEMLAYIFALEQALCPHGRPLWVEITEKELLKRIGRIV